MDFVEMHNIILFQVNDKKLNNVVNFVMLGSKLHTIFKLTCLKGLNVLFYPTRHVYKKKG